MTQREMVVNLADTHDISKAKAERILKDVFSNLQGSLLSEGKCSVSGFGTFKLVQRSERQGRNPKTGESLTIPARTAVKFSASTGLKTAVNS